MTLVQYEELLREEGLIVDGLVNLKKAYICLANKLKPREASRLKFQAGLLADEVVRVELFRRILQPAEPKSIIYLRGNKAEVDRIKQAAKDSKLTLNDYCLKILISQSQKDTTNAAEY